MARPKAPLPEVLPGAFFVLEYDRNSECFILHVDDEDETSYDLGADIPAIMHQMRRWNMFTIGCEAVDRAKEFGAAQAIPEHEDKGRVIALFDRKAKRRPLRDSEEKNYGNLPSLRAS